MLEDKKATSPYLEQADRILGRADFSKEDRSRVDALLAMHDRYDANGIEKRRAEADEIVAFTKYLRGEEGAESRMRKRLAERRDQNTLSGGAGGYTVPQSFHEAVMIEAAKIDPIFELATVIDAPHGRDFQIPTMKNIVPAAVVAEGSPSDDDVDSTFGRVLFQMVTWRSGITRVSRELMTDSPRFAELVAAEIGHRLALGVGAAHTTTLLLDAPVGVTTTAPTAIEVDDVIDLMSEIDNQFASSASWLMNPATWAYLRKLRVTASDALALPAEMMPDGRLALFSRPVYLSPSMPDIAAEAKPISFGDHSRFVRAQAGGVRVAVHNERFAEFDQVGIEGFYRCDGQLLATDGVRPVATLAMAAA